MPNNKFKLAFIKKIIVLLLPLFTFASGYAQHNNFDCLIRQSVGDLNKDGLRDRATISMDTTDKTRPFILEIFFSQPNKTYKLFFSSTKIIAPMYPIEKNGKFSGHQIPDVSIEDGKLLLDFYIDGNSRYHFVLKNGKFELTYFEHVVWDGLHITETEFDLVTGKYSKQSENHETSEITLKIEKEARIRPLPILDTFKPFKNELY